MIPERRLLGYGEAAQYLGMPVGTLHSLVSRRQVPHIRLTARIVKFSVDDLNTLIAERRVPVSSHCAHDHASNGGE